MTPFTKLACALVMTAGLAAPAFAQSTNNNMNGNPNNPNSQNSEPYNQHSSQNRTGMNRNESGWNNGLNNNGWNGGNSGNSNAFNNNGMNGANGSTLAQIGHNLRSDLSKAGFSDISIAPSSFIVHAKDREGNPVVMFINPNSISEFVAEANKESRQTSANGGNSIEMNGQKSANEQSSANHRSFPNSSNEGQNQGQNQGQNEGQNQP